MSSEKKPEGVGVACSALLGLAAELKHAAANCANGNDATRIYKLAERLDVATKDEGDALRGQVEAVCDTLHVGLNIQAQDLRVLKERVRSLLPPNAELSGVPERSKT